MEIDENADLCPELRQLGGFSSPLERSSTPLNVQNPYATPSLLDSEADASFSASTLQQTRQRQSQLRSNDTTIITREREIEEIAKGILDLSTLFRDLQNMVIDQGSMLDRIDYNVDRMAVDVKAADKELTVATGYQKRSVKRKIILLLLLLVVAMFILLGLKLGNRSGKTPAASPPQEPVTPPALNRKSEIFAFAEDMLRRDWRRRRRRLWNFVS
jgi:syntaxin 16